MNEEPVDSRLDSWKEIASFLGRGVRTVQRWEREEGLPVHRLEHARRGSVFAYRHELTAWWESRQSSPTLDPVEEQGEGPDRVTLRNASPPVVLVLVLTVLAVAAAIAAAIAGYRTRADGFSGYGVERVTHTSGLTAWPALSQDGRFVAYASDGGKDGTPLQIWVQRLGGDARTLTDCAQPCTDPSFTPDGSRILYTARDSLGRGLYEVPVAGGPPRPLRRAAHAGRWSPDGRWLAFISDEPPRGLHVSKADGTGLRALAPELLLGDFVVWSPNGGHLLVRGQRQQDQEPDWWIIAPDTGAIHDTQVLRWLRQRGFAGRWHTALPPAWPDETSLVFSDGSNLWRQRLTGEVPQPLGEPEQLTRGAQMAWFAASGGGRVAFVSSNPDVNLRSIRIDPQTGVATGPLERVTRGSGVIQYPSLSADGRWLTYSSNRTGNGDVFLRELGSETEENERTLARTPAREAYSTISPSGRTVAYGVVLPGNRPGRPIILVNTSDGASRQICADCRGRPRAWFDERTLIVERQETPVSSFVLVDVADGSERPLIESREGSVANPRVAPRGGWIAFDRERTGHPPEVFVAPLDGIRPIAEDRWMSVARQAQYPVWSASGGLLYFVSEGGAIRARRVLSPSGGPHGEPFGVLATSEFQLPGWLPGTGPVALRDALLLVLADLRGDVWLMDWRK